MYGPHGDRNTFKNYLKGALTQKNIPFKMNIYVK